MTRKAGLMFGTMLVALCLATTGVGIALLVLANGMPSHTDERRAAELTELYEQNYVRVTPEQGEPAKQEIVALRTSKWKLHNGGLGMCLVSLCLLFASFRFKFWDMRNLRSATTPQTRLGLLGLASAAWWAVLPALQLEEYKEYAQDDLTPNIDTGHGSLWIVGPGLFLLIWIAMLAFGRFFVLRKVLLPANLWCWDNARPYRSLVLSALYGLLGAVLVVLIVWAASNFSWALPSLMVGLYVILSSRAALTNVVRQA
jgi:hypothetical protein